MLDLLAYILFVLFSACFARHSSDVLENYKQHINEIDIRFYSIFRRLIARAPVEGLDGVGSLFGYMAAITATAYFVGRLIGGADPSWTGFILAVFFYSIAGWLAIKWFTKPKRYSFSFLSEMVGISLIPMLMPLVEVLTGVPFTELPYSQLMQLLGPLGISSTNNIWLMGLTVSGFMFSGVIAYWLTMTIIFAPIALTGLVLMVVVLKLGRFIDCRWRARALTPVCFIALMLVSAYGHFS